MTDCARFDIVVVGAGPAGLAAGLALSRAAGVLIAVVAPAAERKDTRTAALFPASVMLLKNLGAWGQCRLAATPLRAIRIVDGIGAPLQAPEVFFRSSEIGLEAFAWNAPNETIAASLRAAAQTCGARITLIDDAVESIVTDDPRAVRLQLASGRRLAAPLVVGADGRNSLCRAAAGIATKAWSYDQSAIACSFAHQRGHDDVSTEIHAPAGPLTTVPMPGARSGLVWVERPDVASRLAALDEAAFRAVLESRLQGLLGSIGQIGPRGLFPIVGVRAETMGARRIALAGEAGHVLPPIGAQGLNLGFRDVAVLADIMSDAVREGRDIGGGETLARYARARAGDIERRAAAVGFLNRALLLSNYPPVHLVRGLGMFALARLGPLRRRLMREGLAPSGVAPRLMRDPETPEPLDAALT